jgi:thiazole synthase ThiGH ThiG subunit
VRCGRDAHQAGLMSAQEEAVATSPLLGFLGDPEAGQNG